MSRLYFDRTLEEVKDQVDRLESDFDNYVQVIHDEIDSLVIDIQEENITDIEDIIEELKGIRDRIELERQ